MYKVLLKHNPIVLQVSTIATAEKRLDALVSKLALSMVALPYQVPEIRVHCTGKMLQQPKVDELAMMIEGLGERFESPGGGPAKVRVLVQTKGRGQILVYTNDPTSVRGMDNGLAEEMFPEIVQV